MDGSLLRPDDVSERAAEQGVALDHLRLGWRPIVARDRRVLGVRIEIRPATNAVETSTSVAGAVIAALADQTTSPSRGIVVLAPTPLSLSTELQLAKDPEWNLAAAREMFLLGTLQRGYANAYNVWNAYAAGRHQPFVAASRDAAVRQGAVL